MWRADIHDKGQAGSISQIRVVKFKNPAILIAINTVLGLAISMLTSMIFRQCCTSY